MSPMIAACWVKWGSQGHLGDPLSLIWKKLDPQKALTWRTQVRYASGRHFYDCMNLSWTPESFIPQSNSDISTQT